MRYKVERRSAYLDHCLLLACLRWWILSGYKVTLVTLISLITVVLTLVQSRVEVESSVPLTDESFNAVVTHGASDGCSGKVLMGK